MVRTRFDEQLELLNVELITMGALCEDAISLAAKVLLSQEGASVEEVAEYEAEINQKEREIESLCMRLLLQQQPVAGDLRVISAALKMISDLERIGDQAIDIAEIADTLGQVNVQNSTHIEDMSRATLKMVSDAVDSFVRRDLDAAHAVIAYDDTVDALFDRIKGELIYWITEDNSNGEVCIDLLMIAKYFERIADHAQNIAEWVEFSLTGMHKGGTPLSM
jgi:phosphate transport system protein